MSKLPAITAALRATLVEASFSVANGDMLSAVLISVLLHLVQVHAKQVGATMQFPAGTVSRNDGPCRSDPPN